MSQNERPSTAEYPVYFETYVSKVPEEDILPVLEAQPGELAAGLAGLPEAAGGFRYAADKWTIREVIGHLIDTERVMAYRALCFARGEQEGLPAFDENRYVENANFEERTLADLLAEFSAVRQANVLLFRNLAAGAWARKGTANNRTLTVRALAWVMAGHVRHHVAVLEERYFTALSA